MPQSLANSAAVERHVVTNNFLWYTVRGAYTLGVRYNSLSSFVGQLNEFGIFRIINNNKIVLSVKSLNIHGDFLPSAINNIVLNHGLFTLTF